MQDLNISELYSAMLRPPLWKGVPHSLLPYLFFVLILFYVGLNPIYGFGSIPLLWLFGYLLGRFDPDFSGVMSNYFTFSSSHITNTKTRTRSYKP